MDPALLSPSVAAARTERGYSVTATFLTAFFGGPLAAVFMHGLNSRFFGRWARDQVLLAAALLLAIGGVIGLAILRVRPDLAPFAPGFFADSSRVRIASRVLALLLWAALYLRLRPSYRAAELMGGHRSGWRDGVICVITAILLQFGLVMLAIAVVRR